MSISFTADNFYVNGKKLEDILTINEDKKMYTIDTDIINGYDNGQQITEQAYEMLLAKGCPEDWFLKGEFEVGDWVVLEGTCETSRNNTGDIGRISEIKECKLLDEPSAIVSAKISDWWDPLKYLRPATPEEIKDRLTEEAKKRGLIDNKYESLQNGGIEVEGSIDEIYYIERQDKLWIGEEGDYFGVAYYKGEWAEPIDTTPDIEINGYKAKKKGELLKFGCLDADKKAVAVLRNSIHKYGLNIVREGKNINKQIHEIHEYYK